MQPHLGVGKSIRTVRCLNGHAGDDIEVPGVVTDEGSGETDTGQVIGLLAFIQIGRR